mgnify:CR=1 FL=1
MVDKIAKQIEVQKVNVKTKTVNQDVVKEKGLVNYPGRSCEQRIPVNFKNSNGTVGRKKGCHKKSA